MFEDCLVAGAVGDALGAEVEFASWGQIQQRHGPDGLREMPAHAEFTDDTQMTLFTAEGVIRTSTRAGKAQLAGGVTCAGGRPGPGGVGGDRRSAQVGQPRPSRPDRGRLAP